MSIKHTEKYILNILKHLNFVVTVAAMFAYYFRNIIKKIPFDAAVFFDCSMVQPVFRDGKKCRMSETRHKLTIQFKN